MKLRRLPKGRDRTQRLAAKAGSFTGIRNMADQWFYGADGNQHGPYSARELRALADAGHIQPADTVWKEGMASGIPAHRVKNLLSPGAAPAGASGPDAGSFPTVVSPATLPSSPPVQPSPEAPAGAETGISPTEGTSASQDARDSPASTATALPGALPGRAEDAEGVSRQPAAPPGDSDAISPDRTASVQKQPNWQQVKKGRAMALKGAVLSSQDGVTVYFMKQCTTCGHQETGRSRMPIRMGVTRTSYFCPKCKRVRPVEIQGVF